MLCASFKLRNIPKQKVLHMPIPPMRNWRFRETAQFPQGHTASRHLSIWDLIPKPRLFSVSQNTLDWVQVRVGKESEWKLRQGMKRENDNPSNRNTSLSNTIPTLHLQCFRWSQHINCQIWWMYGKRLEIHFYETTEYSTKYLWFFLW